MTKGLEQSEKSNIIAKGKLKEIETEVDSNIKKAIEDLKQ